MKKYLITGCAGFIGSNFVYYMLKKYQDIRLVNLDKLTYAGNLENLKGVEGDPHHVFVQGIFAIKNWSPACLKNMTLIMSSTLLQRAMWIAASPTRKTLSRPM